VGKPIPPDCDRQVESEVGGDGQGGHGSARGICASASGHAGAGLGQWDGRARHQHRNASGSAGHGTALDLSADLLEIAKGGALGRGLQNFSTQQADAQALPFPDNSFDLATSRFGVMFFGDVGLAWRELRRVLRDQARACFLAWGPLDQPYWQTTMGVVHGHVGGPLLEAGGPDPFRFAAPGSLSAKLDSAGFREVHEESKTLPWTWPGTPQEVWEQAQAVSVPFRPMLDRVPENLWPRINAEVLVAIGQYVKGENIDFGASVVLASGRK
jgi:SAM-dependent methyltransferase